MPAQVKMMENVVFVNVSVFFFYKVYLITKLGYILAKLKKNFSRLTHNFAKLNIIFQTKIEVTQIQLTLEKENYVFMGNKVIFFQIN